VITGPDVILALKIAVVGATCVFLSSFIPLWRGNVWLHGRINLTFFLLTATALVGLEVIARMIDPNLFDYFDRDPDLRLALNTHLCFSLPAAALMPLMLVTGLTHRRKMHLSLAFVFSVLWTGTFVTGVFFLPHTP
jgi:uncharacterized membrane protein YozB (DUF420 family)